MIKVLAILKSPNTKSSYIRIVQVFKNLDKKQFHIVFVNQKRVNISKILRCTIVVVQRAEDVDLSGWLYFAKLLKKKVIYEIDDDLLDIPAISKLSRKAAVIARNVTKYLGIADLVVCSTSILRDRLISKVGNKRIEVIENIIDVGKYKPLGNNTIGEDIKLVVSNTDYFKLINHKYFIDDIKKLLTEFGDRLKLFFIGVEVDELRNHQSVIHINSLNYSDYMKLIVNMQFTMALVPLEASGFHACKSVIKYLDFSVARIPVICSNVSPYKEIIINRHNGVLVDNDMEGAWYHAIVDLNNDVQLRTKIMGNSMQLINENFRIDIAVNKWMHLIEEVVCVS